VPAGVWEGQFLVPGVGAFLLTADALAGAGDVAALLGDGEVRCARCVYCCMCCCLHWHAAAQKCSSGGNQVSGVPPTADPTAVCLPSFPTSLPLPLQVEVKGRLALQKLDHFLLELRHSRSRTLTLGLLSPAEDCLPEERAALQEVRPGLGYEGWACRPAAKQAECCWPGTLGCAAQCCRQMMKRCAAGVPDITASPARPLADLPPPAPPCLPPRLLQLVGQYTSRGRTGVATPTRDVEAYVLPAGSIADRLLAAARDAAGPQVRCSCGSGLRCWLGRVAPPPARHACKRCAVSASIAVWLHASPHPLPPH
jgi:hypothetical protein